MNGEEVLRYFLGAHEQDAVNKVDWRTMTGRMIRPRVELWTESSPSRPQLLDTRAHQARLSCRLLPQFGRQSARPSWTSFILSATGLSVMTKDHCYCSL